MITGWADFRLPKAGAGRSERKHQSSADDKGKHWRPTASRRWNPMQETFQAGVSNNLSFFPWICSSGQIWRTLCFGPKLRNSRGGRPEWKIKVHFIDKVWRKKNLCFLWKPYSFLTVVYLGSNTHLLTQSVLNWSYFLAFWLWNHTSAAFQYSFPFRPQLMQEQYFLNASP